MSTRTDPQLIRRHARNLRLEPLRAQTTLPMAYADETPPRRNVVLPRPEPVLVIHHRPAPPRGLTRRLRDAWAALWD